LFGRYLLPRIRASLRRSAVNATLALMTMRASVALKLPGATQLMRAPTIVGASYTVGASSENPYVFTMAPALQESIHYLLAQEPLTQPGRESWMGQIWEGWQCVCFSLVSFSY
jgi:hypothetical protein